MPTQAKSNAYPREYINTIVNDPDVCLSLMLLCQEMPWRSETVVIRNQLAMYTSKEARL